MIPNILMLVGAAVWLTGELWGAYFRKKSDDTTSEFVWHIDARWPIARVLIGVFIASLFGHLIWHGPLLP